MPLFPILEETFFMASTDSQKRSLRHTFSRLAISRLVLAITLMICCAMACQKGTAADGFMKRTISDQSKNDLFANYYEGPQPCGRTASMYVSPLPIPPHVGHTYVTYQPIMPHEYLYQHTRSHYSHVPGAGWTRAKVRYRTYGLIGQDIWHKLSNKF